ncbi:MAG: response regulator [Alphaproteobacteria bacterium]|nr:response regulator [Alphaproteobacteria bacterium]
MDDLISEFLTETNESLDELDLDLVNLEQNPNDKDLLGKIFRLMHTIKGTCGFLGLPRLEKVAHHAENVLGRFRDGDLEVTPDYVTLIFESIDQIKFIVRALGEKGSEPQGSDAELIAKLDAAYEGKDVSGGSATPVKTAPAKKEDDIKIKVLEKTADDLAPGEVSMEELEAAFAAAPGMDGIINPADLEKEHVVEQEALPEPAVQKEASEEKAAAKDAPAAAAQTLRINVDVLEDLMTMVSELVLTRNQLLQIVREQSESEFAAPLQRLNHVVSELQEGVMKTRMQPIGNAWSKLPRIIRDLAMELNKKIELIMSGNETELDRQVLEMIKDPLTHMVRNSGDHGIEKPEDRIAAGKPETGKIWLDAYHEGGHIIIKIRDDGKGLAEEKIKAKILQNGLATAEEIANMTTQQIQQFIFNAGFSTAEKVTSVSGRGVGMDVVRTNIEKIGGSIELKSEEGKGSTFTIKIPLTLAIVSALIVEAAGERFAIPQLSVRELVMVSEQGDNRVEYIKGSPVFRLRDRLLPLVSLGNILGLTETNALHQEEPEKAKSDKKSANGTKTPATAEKASQDVLQTGKTKEKITNEMKKHKRNLYLVVAQVGGYDFGIIVDKVFDTEEIVVKPVATMLKELTLFSGNTILGDGSVIMILDPNGIANATGNVGASEEKDALQNASAVQADSEKKTSLLLFKAGDQTPKAVPLSLVARLEHIKLEDVEYSSGQMTVQYRESLMPLVPFNTQVQVGNTAEKPVLVFASGDQSLGIIVDEIVDISEAKINIQLSTKQPGILGSAIIGEDATDIVDISHFLEHANSDWFKDHDDTPFDVDGTVRSTNKKKRVLLVDDSPFFRNMLTPLLSMAGYEVTTMERPTDALKLCEDGVNFDVIISDIEMPDMNGFEFAEEIKKEESKWSNTPLVALSSHATPQDIERGIRVGFQQYVAKFDKETLLTALSQTLS